MSPFFVFALLAGQTPKFAANYITHTQDSNGREVERFDPPGQVRVLTLSKNQRWVWRDALISLDGRWSASGNVIRLVAVNGSAGKLKKSQTMILKADPSGKRLTLVSPVKPGFKTTFVNDPKMMQKLAQEFRRRVERMKAHLAQPGKRQD